MSSSFSPERWRLIEPLIDAATDLPPAERPAFLDTACRGDTRLRAELEQLLLDYDRSDTLLDHPAAERFATLLVAPAPPLPELVNGNFQVERKVGQGGMATVYLARDTRHDRNVALKVMHPELAAAFRGEQFLAEIRTMAQLHHPHILPLFDSGEVDGQLYFVMPFVEGETLRQRITRESQLGLGETVRIAREVASALDHAHRHGVVHRDIKPDNILLGEGGAQVADFGIALAISAASSRSTEEPRLIAGTPRYMSPEQLSGSTTVDSRADIYSLGILCYEMLAGRPPVPASAPPSLHQQRSAVPAAADAVVARSLATLPDDRYATAGELVDALDAALSRHGSRRTRWAGAALVVGVLALAAVVGAGRLRGPRTPTLAAILPSPHQTENVAAYDLYQRGRDQAWSRSDGGARRAIEYFQQAILADSTYAAAYAELAHMYAVAVLGNSSPDLTRAQAAARAQATALKAVALDDSLADAHAELGFVNMFAAYDLRSVEDELKRAAALDPGSARPERYLANFYEWTERPVEALQAARRARDLDPLSVEETAGLAIALSDARHDEEALAQLASLRQVVPPVRRVSQLTGHVYVMMERWNEALDQYRDCCGEQSGFFGRTLALARRRAEARQVLDSLLALSARGDGDAFDVAMVYEGLGDYDQAFEWLDRSFDDHSAGLYIMSPTFARLRADPRFERVRDRLNAKAR